MSDQAGVSDRDRTCMKKVGKIITDPNKMKIRISSIGHEGEGTFLGTIGYVQDCGGRDEGRGLRILIISDTKGRRFPMFIHREVTVDRNLDLDLDAYEGMRVGYEIKDNKAISIWPLEPGEVLPFS